MSKRHKIVHPRFGCFLATYVLVEASLIIALQAKQALKLDPDMSARRKKPINLGTPQAS
jgi:hypothetical protein